MKGRREVEEGRRKEEDVRGREEEVEGERKEGKKKGKKGNTGLQTHTQTPDPRFLSPDPGPQTRPQTRRKKEGGGCKREGRKKEDERSGRRKEGKKGKKKGRFFSTFWGDVLAKLHRLSDPRNRNHKSLAIANRNFEVASFSRRNRSEIAVSQVFSESQ